MLRAIGIGVFFSSVLEFLVLFDDDPVKVLVRLSLHQPAPKGFVLEQSGYSGQGFEMIGRRILGGDENEK
jgi:hypothetical protein